MDKKNANFLYLMALASLLVSGLIFLIVGAKNLNDASDIAKRIEPSKIYERYGFTTIEAWRASFEKKNRIKLFAGVGLIVLTAGIVLVKKR